MELMEHLFLLHGNKGHVVTIFGYMCQSIYFMLKKLKPTPVLASKDKMQQI